MTTDRLRTLVGPLDRPDLAVPLLLFTAFGIAVSFYWLPASWGVLGRLVVGVGMGISAWMFPYLNRALEG